MAIDATSGTQVTQSRVGFKGFPWLFVILTYGISWLCFVLVALTGTNSFSDLETGFVLMLGGFGPAIAGTIMVYRSGDGTTISEYWRRVFDVKRIRPLWWLPMLLLYPAAVVVAFVVLGRTLDVSPLQALLQNPASLLVTLIFVFFFGPFSEELGWRGYALDWLQARYTALTASIILGVIWWVWHLPLLAVSGSFLSGTGTDPIFLLGYLGTVVLYSVLFTWITNNNGSSILAAVLAHFSINLTSRLIAMPPEVFVVTAIVLIVVIAGIVFVFGHRRLVRGQSL